MLWRCNIQLAVPKDAYDALPTARKLAARDAIRDLKSLAVKINAGTPNEEMTVKADWHWCSHDTNPTAPCVEQEI